VTGSGADDKNNALFASGFDISAARDEYMSELVGAGLLIPTGVPGILGRNRIFEAIIDGLLAAVATRADDAIVEYVRFPPIIPRADYLRSGHLSSFPHLGGSVHAFIGEDRAHREMLRKAAAGERWTDDLEPTDAVLTPACCYPVYPMCTGILPEEGRTIDILGYCFRHEPSNDPMRMQAFRQMEHVRLGSPEQIALWRDKWLERSQELLTDLELEFSTDVATDPFFGRGGKFMSATQLEQELKFELNVAILHADFPTACVSLNNHEQHFTHEFGITRADGSPAWTGCIGFGLERLTLALLKRHGFDPDRWPTQVRSALT
jgi:seryl-tRNA synthetase